MKDQTYTVKSESELISLGKTLAKTLVPPVVIELVGDVGAGKTTFTRGLAEGLGIKSPITSPSFTISKEYAYKKDDIENYLVHYDFYRLSDPGIMAEDLAEHTSNPHTITVVEWAGTVKDILPPSRLTIRINTNPDASRTVIVKKGTK